MVRGRLLRAVFRREVLPERVLWWLAADAMLRTYRMFARGLTEPLGGRGAAEQALAQATAPMLRARYDLLREEGHPLPDPDAAPQAVPDLMAALYRLHRQPRAAWILGGAGSSSAGGRPLRGLSIRRRWDEVATHLGEALVAWTQRLPDAGLRRTNAVLGRICHESGLHYGARTKAALRLPETPEAAIEVLRMGEYIFQVNPEHWQETDGRSGYLEGNACPWYSRPGWEALHCGVFGQFQSGISEAFGLRYHLTETIPRHGGGTCRVDLVPIGEPRRRHDPQPATPA